MVMMMHNERVSTIFMANFAVCVCVTCNLSKHYFRHLHTRSRMNAGSALSVDAYLLKPEKLLKRI